MKNLMLSVTSFLISITVTIAQTGPSDFEVEYVKKNLIKKVKTTYEYYEANRKGKAKKRDRRIGRVVYTYDDDGRISKADFFDASGSPSHKDEYTYDDVGRIASVKKSQVLSTYDNTQIEKVYHYELVYNADGTLDHCDLDMYDVRNGKKGYGSGTKRLEQINIYYPSCFKSDQADAYERNNKGLITKLTKGNDEEQTFEYEFF